MHQNHNKTDASKLKEKLRRLRVASWSLIEQGNCRAVARLTCEAVRLQEAIDTLERPNR